MHSSQTTNGLRYSHNGDFSGDIVIETPNGAIRIPFTDLRDIVANAVVRRRVEKLEQMNADEILGL